MVSVITGKSAHEEASDGTRSFDLVRAVRARRLQAGMARPHFAHAPKPHVP